MPELPDGLASLSQARESRRVRRTMPPPRHPVAAPAETAKANEPDGLTSEPVASTVGQNAESNAGLATEITTGSAEQAPAASASVAAGAARPTTVHLGDEQLDYLESARIAGLVSRPRVDVSKSAVVRLALRRLQQEMTPEQVRDLLASQPTGSGPGRKRR